MIIFGISTFVLLVLILFRLDRIIEILEREPDELKKLTEELKGPTDALERAIETNKTKGIVT